MGEVRPSPWPPPSFSAKVMLKSPMRGSLKYWRPPTKQTFQPSPAGLYSLRPSLHSTVALQLPPLWVSILTEHICGCLLKSLIHISTSASRFKNRETYQSVGAGGKNPSANPRNFPSKFTRSGTNCQPDCLAATSIGPACTCPPRSRMAAAVEILGVFILSSTIEWRKDWVYRDTGMT